MAQQVVVRVPLPSDDALALLMRAAARLHHTVQRVDPDSRTVQLAVDFNLRAFATFRMTATVMPLDHATSQLTLRVRPAFKLTPWTGIGTSGRIAWELVGAMQELHDAAAYRRLGARNEERRANP